MLSRLRAAARSQDKGSPNGGRIVMINLVLVLAFVVVVVIELTRTWLGARHIAAAVATADQNLVPVRNNTEQVQRLDRTMAITEQIDQASQPLERESREILARANNIDANATSVQHTVVAINDQVKDINAIARGISTTAGTLTGTVLDIQNIVASIQGDASGINQRFATLLPITTMIAYGPPPYGVNTINENTDTIIGLSRGILADLDDIRTTVPEIDHHAASICRSILVMGPNCGALISLPPLVPAQPPGRAPVAAPAPAAAGPGAVIPAAGGRTGGAASATR